MKKLVAVSSMVALPSVLGLAQALPGIVTILLFSVAPVAGVLPTLGITGLGITSALFTYFVSGAFPSTTVSNWIIGL